MRSRTVKPGFFRNESVGECDPFARLLFVGMLCAADCEGRLEDRPKKIRAEILPYDDVDGEVMLGQLHAAGLIVRYEVDGRKLIQIPKFKDHQNPHPREQASTLPPPANMPGREKVMPSRGKARPGREKVMPGPSAFSVSSAFSEPSALPPPEDIGRASARPRSRTESAEGFKAFWKLFPLKVKKIRAEKLWNKLAPDVGLVDIILAAVKRQKLSTDWTKDGGKYVPHPTNWLEDRRWEDEPAEAEDPGCCTDAELDAAFGPRKRPTLAELKELGLYHEPGSVNGATPEGGAAC
jgi:hypothetical protein